MTPIVRRTTGWVGALAVVAAGFATLAPSPALGADAVTLAALTPSAQVKGEVSLLGSVGDSSTTPTVEQYSAGRWKSLGSAAPGNDGSFVATYPADTTGNTYFRATVPTSGSSAAATSAIVRVWVFAESDQPFSSTSIPAVVGDQTVGTKLQADPGSWDPKPDYFTYRWNRNGVSTGVTGRTYTLTGADLGAYVTVTAAGWRSGRLTLRDSRPTTRVSQGAFHTTQPEIVGRAVVGQSLQAVVTGWSPMPSDLIYQWSRDGTAIENATTSQYLLTSSDVGTSLTVTAHGTATGVDPADTTSKPFVVPGRASRAQRTFADAMAPVSSDPWTTADLTYEASGQAPAWGTLTRTRWDGRRTFTFAQKPRPAGTLISAIYDKPWTRADTAEFTGTNPSLKNADVTFTVSARRFSIVYRGNEKSDAMVWVNSRPIAAQPIRGVGAADTSAWNWISITLPTQQTSSVRFAGPLTFSGVDTPATENALVREAPPTFTLGVLSDSYYEVCSDTQCMSRNAAPTLATLTGFRVWNMSESGTGWVAPGPGGPAGYESSPYGSTKRLDGVLAAPLDALIIGGSVNDGLRSADLHRPAVDTLLTQLEQQRPDLPVVLLGIEPLPGTYRSAYWINRANGFSATLKSMVGRHQNVVGFIDPFTNPWLTGTGNIAKPTGDGNGDQYVGSDGVHLGAAGIRYYQQRVVDELRQLPLPSNN
jgi:hypothetical protein